MMLDDEPVYIYLGVILYANLPSLYGFQAMFEPVILDVLRV